MKINRLFNDVTFKNGFWIGISLSVFLNLLGYFYTLSTYHNSKIAFAHPRGYVIGLPFAFYRWDLGYPYRSYFVGAGLIIDVLAGIVFSFIVALIFKFVWEKYKMNGMR